MARWPWLCTALVAAPLALGACHDAESAENAANDGSGGAAACDAESVGDGFFHGLMPNPGGSALPNPARYTVAPSGESVTDDVSGLIWQRRVGSQVFTWQNATHYCACLSLDGIEAWRLPTRVELASLVDWTKTSPSIDSDAFPATPNANFWSASEVVINPGLIYLVYFVNGHTTYSAFDYEYPARCVHAKPAVPGPRYQVETDTARDVATQLTWQREFTKTTYGWEEATQYCDQLALAGGGWRLPSIGELQTLVDDTRNPAIDPLVFPQTPSEYFWSSSAVIDDATRSWTAFFTNGSTYSFAKTAKKYARCVR